MVYSYTGDDEVIMSAGDITESLILTMTAATTEETPVTRKFKIRHTVNRNTTVLMIFPLMSLRLLRQAEGKVIFPKTW